MDNCFVVFRTHQICNASAKANAHELQNDPITQVPYFEFTCSPKQALPQHLFRGAMHTAQGDKVSRLPSQRLRLVPLMANFFLFTPFTAVFTICFEIDRWTTSEGILNFLKQISASNSKQKNTCNESVYNRGLLRQFSYFTCRRRRISGCHWCRCAEPTSDSRKYVCVSSA